MNLNSEEIVQAAINELINDFKANRDCFFNEHDLHHVFYCKLSRLGNLVRPEYPTRRRFFVDKDESEKYSRGEHSFPPRGENVPPTSKRDHYDFAILSESFYNKFKKRKGEKRFERLSSKNIDTNLDLKNEKYVDIAMEFKYITGKCQAKTIDFDIFKLKEAEEVNKKIFLVFIRKRWMSRERYDNIVQFLKERKKEAEAEDIQMEIIEATDDSQSSFT